MNQHESTHAIGQSRTQPHTARAEAKITLDLSGLRGEGGFEGCFGKGSDGTLDYWFE